MHEELLTLRASVNRVMLPWLWLHIPVIAAVCWAFGHESFWPCVMAAVVASTAAMTCYRSPLAASTRMTVAIALIAMVSFVLAACYGSAWQNDAHLYYFAALAMLAAYCDRNVILVATGATALHHLGLDFVAPALVFPGGAQFGHVLLHAGVLIIEAATLVWMVTRIIALFASSASHLAAASQAAEETGMLEAKAARQRIAAEQARLEMEADRASRAEVQSSVVSSMGIGLDRVASGVLTFRISKEYSEDYENLRLNFNEALEQLDNLVGSVVANISGVRLSADEISRASDDLSRRTEQQAASLEEAAAAVDHVTALATKTAEGAMQASAAVFRTQAAGETSGVTLRQAIASMHCIEQSSKEVTLIIGVVDEIAFQINLLALNAGVEAARAGDAGCGFAFVASEVRALAQRSTEAAKQIKDLISVSSRQVATGVTLVGETGQALSEILGQVTEIATVVADIAASADEQAIALREVNTVVYQLDQVTQKNASMCEQTSAASRSLAEEAADLACLTERFEVSSTNLRPQAGAHPNLPQIRDIPKRASVKPAPYPLSIPTRNLATPARGLALHLRTVAQRREDNGG